MCRSPRKFALVAIQLSLDAAQGRPSIGGCNGANPTLGCSGSPFRRRRFLYGSSISLLWWGARHDTDYRHCGPSLEGLIFRQPQRVRAAPLTTAERGDSPQQAAVLDAAEGRGCGMDTSRLV